MADLLFASTDDRFYFEEDIKKLKISKSAYLKRYRSLVKKLKDFRISQRSKQAWRRYRPEILRGMRRFRRSVEGKRFYRNLVKKSAFRFSEGHFDDIPDLKHKLGFLISEMIKQCEVFSATPANQVDYLEFFEEAHPIICEAIASGNFESEEFLELFNRLCFGREWNYRVAGYVSVDVSEVDTVVNRIGKKLEEHDENYSSKFLGTLAQTLSLKG